MSETLETSRGREVFRLSEPLRSPGDWYHGGRVLRRRLAKVAGAWEWQALGVVLPGPGGLYWVERQWLLSRPANGKAPPSSGPFPTWVDVVGALW